MIPCRYMERREKKLPGHSIFFNLYNTENPASYLIAVPPMIPYARIMERREKNMVRHSIFQNLPHK